MRTQLKFSPAGRFMWQLGTKTVDRLGLPSLQNCAFTVVNEPIKPFIWAFELLMLGAGKQTMPLITAMYYWTQNIGGTPNKIGQYRGIN